jgi:hypothetical protein
MSAGNFNWFLHTMLFLHTERILKKQLEKQRKKNAGDDDDDDDDDDSDGVDETDD